MNMWWMCAWGLRGQLTQSHISAPWLNRLTIYLWEWGSRADLLIDLIHAHTYTVQHPRGFDIRMLGLIFHIDEVQIKNKREVCTESWTIPDPQYTHPHEAPHDLYIILHPLFVSHTHNLTLNVYTINASRQTSSVQLCTVQHEKRVSRRGVQNNQLSYWGLLNFGETSRVFTYTVLGLLIQHIHLVNFFMKVW